MKNYCRHFIFLKIFFILCSFISESRTIPLTKGSIIYDIGDLENISEIKMREMSTTVQIRLESPLRAKVNRWFRIISPNKDFSLMAFVKSAHLRVKWTQEEIHKFSSPEEQAHTYSPQCQDYISFEWNERVDKICHEVEAQDKGQYGGRLVGPRVIRSDKGQLGVKIHTDYFSSLPKNESKLLAEIVFTAYADCWSRKESSDWRRCSKGNSVSCIDSGLFCDGNINCLFEDAFGIDEKNCTGDETEISGHSENSWTYNNEISKNNKVLTMKVDNRERVESENYGQIRQYFVPTGFIFFVIWGLIILLRKSYKCYRTEFLKDELYIG